MSTEIITADAAQWSSEQVDLLKRTICKGATDDELALFVSTAKRLHLDPFARQIFAVKRWDSNAGREVMAIQVSIDGFRLVAQRSGEYEGQTPTQWCGQDGGWRDVWLMDDPPAAARVGVHRRGFREPLYAVANWSSYKQTKKGGDLNAMWAKFGPLMLGKCAEALALRKAYPAELSGLYSPEEMGQAEDAAPPSNGKPAARTLADVSRDADTRKALPPPAEDAPQSTLATGTAAAAALAQQAVLTALGNATATRDGFLQVVMTTAPALGRLPVKLRAPTWDAIVKLAADASVTEQEVREAVALGREQAHAGSDDPAAREAAAKHDRDWQPKFGKSMGIALRDMPDEHVSWHADNRRKDLANPEKERFHRKAAADLATLEAEMGLRARGGATTAPPADDFGPPEDDDIPY